MIKSVRQTDFRIWDNRIDDRPVSEADGSVRDSEDIRGKRGFCGISICFCVREAIAYFFARNADIFGFLPRVCLCFGKTYDKT